MYRAEYSRDHEGHLDELTQEKVIDVDENRDVLDCLRHQEAGKEMENICYVDHSPKRITHERFEELRRQYLER